MVRIKMKAFKSRSPPRSDESPPALLPSAEATTLHHRFHQNSHCPRLLSALTSRRTGGDENSSISLSRSRRAPQRRPRRWPPGFDPSNRREDIRSICVWPDGHG
ncbi:F-BOX WITH WD-40 2 [Striga asiatica]|uniref:F-BOX WITH WD-40 2 n=1 Tax=Striga asiatica TaxID=4170 RepID=A0A5A7PCN2_STRAF|nr:F-BOX WITH WD-40 2 [Striga asiatica]